jgi:glutaminyl-tRNA synthetase
LYDWVLDHVDAPCHPQQIEFARLNLSYTVLSKRKLIQLVDEGCGRLGRSAHAHHLRPAAPGLHPEAIRNFCDRIGLAKRDSVVDVALLEYSVREDLNKRAPRVMGVLRPLKVVIENYPEGQVDELDAVNNPEDPDAGVRKVPFSREIYIERDDFMENPPKKFFRLGPGREVRLRYAFFVVCTDVIKDEKTGEVIELRCTYDPATRGGDAPDGRKVKATLHWVSAAHAVDAEVRLYDRLFNKANPDEKEDGKTYKDFINPNALEVLHGLQTGALPGRCRPGLFLPVRAHGVLLCGFEQRFQTRRPGVQPHGDPAGRLGQAEEKPF